MWLEVAQLQMDKTYEWIEDRYADEVLGPEQPAPGSASAAAGAAGEDSPLTDLKVMQKTPNFSREMCWITLPFRSFSTSSIFC